MGMKIGKNVFIRSGVYFDGSFCFLISIGDNSVISVGVQIFAHDAYNNIVRERFMGLAGFTRVGKVAIHENCVIGRYSYILPGISIGPNSMVAPHSVVTCDVPPNSIAAGNPARVISDIDSFLKKHTENFKKKPVFDFKTFFDLDKREETLKKLEGTFGYVSSLNNKTGKFDQL